MTYRTQAVVPIVTDEETEATLRRSAAITSAKALPIQLAQLASITFASVVGVWWVWALASAVSVWTVVVSAKAAIAQRNLVRFYAERYR